MIRPLKQVANLSKVVFGSGLSFSLLVSRVSRVSRVIICCSLMAFTLIPLFFPDGPPSPSFSRSVGFRSLTGLITLGWVVLAFVCLSVCF